MAYTTIDNPELYFQVKTYTGNGSTQSITLDGSEDMAPDLVWMKQRNAAQSHVLIDSVRGVLKRLRSDQSDAEDTKADSLTAFGTDGFTLGSAYEVNYASWNWKANGSGSANTDGSISSTVSANAVSGFSIVKWSGSGSNATIGHGLGVAPKMVITKSLGSSAWGVYNENLGNTNILFLDTSAATSAHIAYWNNTSPTSSVFTVGSDDAVNHSGNNMIAYCFAEKQGYSKFGSYIGQNPAGSSNKQFIYTGFKPSFVMIKESSGNGHWVMYDNKRENTFNPTTGRLVADDNGSENINSDAINLLSNGFYITDTSNDLRTINANNETYTFMSFAEAPFVTGSGGVPCNAR